MADMNAMTGELCQIQTEGRAPVMAEVVGFANGRTQLMPLERFTALVPGSQVIALNRNMTVPVGPQLRGRILDGLGRPIDDGGPLVFDELIPLLKSAPNALQRAPVNQPLETGQRVIDSMLTLGVGQRVGLFAGSGVGKSTLLGEIAREARSDINVVVLVGERGREVRPFIEECLGEKGKQRSIVIISTADDPPLVRVRSVQTAIAIADWFRCRGQHVLFMVDSLTRLAWAQRDLGLSVGEPPSARGFPPSSIQILSTLIEQLGTGTTGAISGILTVLVDGDDTNEPVSDAARAILDGHIVLSRKLAEKGHFPAIDVLSSVSRVANRVVDTDHQSIVAAVRKLLGEYREVEDLLRIGAYQKGVSAEIDEVIRLKPRVDAFFQQSWNETTSFTETGRRFRELLR